MRSSQSMVCICSASCGEGFSRLAVLMCRVLSLLIDIGSMVCICSASCGEGLLRLVDLMFRAWKLSLFLIPESRLFYSSTLESSLFTHRHWKYGLHLFRITNEVLTEYEPGNCLSFLSQKVVFSTHRHWKYGLHLFRITNEVLTEYGLHLFRIMWGRLFAFGCPDYGLHLFRITNEVLTEYEPGNCLSFLSQKVVFSTHRHWKYGLHLFRITNEVLTEYGLHLFRIMWGRLFAFGCPDYGLHLFRITNEVLTEYEPGNCLSFLSQKVVFSTHRHWKYGLHLFRITNEVLTEYEPGNCLYFLSQKVVFSTHRHWKYGLHLFRIINEVLQDLDSIRKEDYQGY
ncbi:hypothetical protein CLU79DRAFT_840432 [Phycomyces nitens]|nr:hypothetical protein CLU79DRAFT_840432 [Phycomyces nitens]